MDSKNIMFDMDEGRFHYRVGAIIANDDNVLMVQNIDDSYYYTVGGRVHLGESAEEAVLREAFEETKIYFEIERLMCIHEIFFTFEGDDKPNHVICLFFLMKPNDTLKKAKLSSFKEEYGDVLFHWLPIDNLDGLQAYPSFLKHELQNPSKQIKHYVTKDGVTTLKS